MQTVETEREIVLMSEQIDWRDKLDRAMAKLSVMSLAVRGIEVMYKESGLTDKEMSDFSCTFAFLVEDIKQLIQKADEDRKTLLNNLKG